jgi:Ca2+-binding EF-hand superfamily protein
MTFKSMLVSGISVLAVSSLTLPAFASGKAKGKTKSHSVECTVTVDDGETEVVKTVNGKAVKTDMDDKDCNIKLHRISDVGEGENMRVYISDDGGEKHVKVMRMRSGPENEMRMVFKGDGDFPIMGEKAEITDLMFRGDDGHSMRWMGKGGMPGSFPGLHRMGGNSSQFMMMGEDNEALDLNKDGTVSPAEARKARDAKLKSYDSNRDGKLSLNEFQAYWLSKRHAQMVDAFQDLDEDGDAQVTGDEFSASAVRTAKMQARMKRMMEEHKSKAKAEKSKARRKRK